MIRNTIATINERIAGQLLTDAVGIYAIAAPFADQAEKATGLLLEGGKRFSLDSKLVWQSLHLTDGSSIAGQSHFGSFTDTIYDVRFVLVGVSKSVMGFDLAMRSLDGVGYVVIDNFDKETLSVLTRYLRIKTGQEKNYDPSLFAFAIRYHIEGVDDEDFAELAGGDLATLPTEVPEPIIGPPGPAGPAGSSLGGNYVHVQGAPSSDWHIKHDLQYNPGGIQVYDSAGEAWLPVSITYVDLANLILHFGGVQFAGKAYLS